MPYAVTVPHLGTLSLLLTLLLAACGGSEDELPPIPVFRLDGGYPSHQSADNDLSVIFGTPDLAVGSHRIAFALSDTTGIIHLPTIELRAYPPPPASNDDLQRVTASFAEFPLGLRGVYLTNLNFDQPGEWHLETTIATTDRSTSSIRFPVTITDSTSAPDIGTTAPRSVSRTLDDVASLLDLSSGANPDPALYTTSIDAALDDGRPLVIVFASPGFCTNTLCGPAVEMLSELRARYPNQATYIHVDIYENPQQLRQGDIHLARRTPLLDEWGLNTDEWTFIIDADRRVIHRFESFAPLAELESALLPLIVP